MYITSEAIEVGVAHELIQAMWKVVFVWDDADVQTAEGQDRWDDN